MKRKQWFTQKTPSTTTGFDHLVFDGSERYLAWVDTEEDARLIAAAPELLSLLKEARSTLEMWKDVAPAVSLCADIDRAIAKATGAQP